ncbi:MAG: hypothetical protein IJ191_08510 [Treponema sp.]|nr:hypothetical protein [Treponema sp.]
MAVWRVKYEKKNGNVTTTQVTANSESEARQKVMMSTDTKRVMAAVRV